ncbi:glutamate synthase large subunit [Rhodospirillaceae bacterium KN72]|uniref:Glutamate synthase [NADPH] large chain n=1 Tax=Pacificispira spongiicola TaxID=2729598 RepID=A0A7Y0E1L6_9PROT|nr:glutamate synthase large subunit [Pacificispira spongiicola]NMM44776.1 glutamate synthase large subunit [Pacificispira spongiicola]
MTDTTYGQSWVSQYRADAERLAKEGMYLPQTETANCGVGMIAAIDGQPRRDVVLRAVEALKALWHRGAVDADGKTGDGAGIHVQIPQDFFKEHVQRTGHQLGKGRLAVGMVFLPRTDLGRQERVRQIVESEILRLGHRIYGWRQVPVNVSVIGDKANATRPEIEQIMVENAREVKDAQFEADLYVIRRRIEKAVLAENLTEAYICSLSCRSVIYKGLFLAEQLTAFYPDLNDERFTSNFAIYHQRYSTNTFPSWSLAQPFRVLAHNGEINTIDGNINWMKSHETKLDDPQLGPYVDDIKPIVQPGSSDSSALDAVFEVLVRTHRELPEVKSLLIPEAWEQSKTIPQAHRNFYQYANGVMEPWDGPAAICAYGGRWALAGLDRNGLRPLRYVVTGDGLLIVGSEVGMVKISETDVVEKGRLGPGQMIAVDLWEGKLCHDRELKDHVAALSPFGEWVKNIVNLSALDGNGPGESGTFSREELRRRMLLSGWSMEDLELILQPMAETGKEATGSMGDDTPIAVLSDLYRGMHHYFRQNFSQVTNPPIDSLRERYVMSLATRLGNLGNILEEDARQLQIVQLPSPVLLEGDYRALRNHLGGAAVEIDCTFAVDDNPNAMGDAVHAIQARAEEAVREGAQHLILDDSGVSPERVAIPMILAAGAVHTHLVRANLRTFASLIARTSEALDTHSFAVMIGVGTTAVVPYLAQEAIADRHRRNLLGGVPLDKALANFKKAIEDGLLKIMSKMGISIVSSYRGGYNFEAVGLSRSLVAEFFPGLPSRISGVGLTGLRENVVQRHNTAFDDAVVALPVGGFFRYRRGGEAHAWEGNLIHTLQSAVASDSFSVYRRYAEQVANLPPISLRDLMDFNYNGPAAPIDEVESITEIRKRLVAPGISLGALSPIAHETLSIAMNRIGAKSDSGEGGEDPARYKPKANGDNASSAIKQVASGRFGVTAEYLNNCREIEIKMAQGAKPGEGGQLPGFKVSKLIAKLRHSTPGVTLISPPPHHDIYSIEDLAQLIYDLKQINPEARVCVKLVSKAGIGTVAAGVAKAHADTILISGHSGGTGASPQTSIKYAGLPWEMGLTEAHQVLTLNGLRHRVRLRVDGGIKTGRDVVMAAILGADEFGIGTASLVAMGCIMVRQCHSNTCPVGVCTQDDRLIEKFTGTPEKVMNLFSFIAEEIREILASLGARSLSEVIGRTELLAQVSRGASHLDDLDLNPLLTQPGHDRATHPTEAEGRNEVPETLDALMIQDAENLFREGEKMQLQYNIRNTYRAIGTKISSKITREFGMKVLKPGHLTVRMRGSAGQSLGAFAVQGLKLEVLGDANDYVGKGLSGGDIVVRPITASPLESNRNAIIGNTCLFGATDGHLYAAGMSGDRFAARNSGAVAVVEGVGSNGCEYMTGGLVCILGTVGDNFAAGMTGGMAFVYDPDDQLTLHLNTESVDVYALETDHWAGVCRKMIEDHVKATHSKWATGLLDDWDLTRAAIKHVAPREILSMLDHPLGLEEAVAQPAE